MASAAASRPLDQTLTYPIAQIDPPPLMRRRTNPQIEPFKESSPMAATTLRVTDLTPAITGAGAETLPDPSSGCDAELGRRIYTALASDKTIRTELRLDSSYGFLFSSSIIPRLLEIRRSILESPDEDPDHIRSISSKDPRLQFGSYGKANMRIKNGKTYITLPHMTPLVGSMKIVKYMIAISPGGSQISLEMMSKIKKEKGGIKPFRTPEMCRKFIAIASVLQSFKHPNILATTDLLIPSPKKGYELITPKCETALFEFLQKYQDIPIEKQARDCLCFMQEITSALKYVHDRGYLHCDLKPENILIQREPDGTLKTMLMDFDLLSKYDDPSQRLRGTEAYVPPSYLISGKKNDLTTELYALGITLHADPVKLVSFTRRLSRLEKLAAAEGNEPLSIAIHKLTADITTLSERLTHDGISDYTTVLRELDKVALQFDCDLAGA
ncbi:MAG: protein kinase family protein [Chlamydiae bacterium]|nr:protein kinase family protein [Chlamydiota bacterium]